MTTCTLWRCVISLALSPFHSLPLVVFLCSRIRPGNILAWWKTFRCGCPLNWQRAGMAGSLARSQCCTYYYYFRFLLFYHFRLVFFTSFYFTWFYFGQFYFILLCICVHFVSHWHQSDVGGLLRSCVWLFVCLFYSCVHLLCYQWRVSVSRVRVVFL